MSQLACPLCGRFVSIERFDPSGFESDIFAVNVRGLGRGRGFAVSEIFSVLGEPAVTGPIAERCRIILGLIEGGKILSGGEAGVVEAELERWKGEAVREKKTRDDLLAKLAEVEGQALFWMKEASRPRSGREEYAAKLAVLEDEARKWRNVVTGLRAEVKGLKSELDSRDDDVVEDEEETLAVEEMQEILHRINTSANTDFGYLSDAVNFLLEGG